MNKLTPCAASMSRQTIGAYLNNISKIDEKNVNGRLVDHSTKVME